MPFTLVQAGSALQSINSFGGISAALSLPSGITLRTDRTPRFAKFGSYVVVVNTPSRPLLVDTSGIVYPLTPIKPSAAVALAATGSGSLTGAYLALQTYVIKDSLGNLITESDFGPVMSASVSTTAQQLAATYGAGIDDSVALVSRLYRTTAGGSSYLQWVDSGTNNTTLTDGTTDAALSTTAAPSRGTAPDLTLVVEWAGRLWGVDRTDVDHLRYTEAGTSYGWSTLNTLLMTHAGADAAGIVGLAARRDALGVARTDVFQQVTGSLRTNFRPTTVNGGEKVGCLSQESMATFNDVVYFLWRDGVYKWDSSGISSITDGRVRTWFTTDTYFNRSMFWRAFAMFDQAHLQYHLFLASTGSAVIDRWITYDLSTGSWWGPHKTVAFNPSSAIMVAGTDQNPYPMIGTLEMYLSQQQDAKNDWGGSPIALSVKTNNLDMNVPDLEKYYGELSVFTKVQAAGTLSITPAIGSDPDSLVAQTPFSHAMTSARTRLGRIGVGQMMTLQFDHSTINQDVVLRAFEVDPVNPVGRR